jgi:hypothetical protein
VPADKVQQRLLSSKCLYMGFKRRKRAGLTVMWLGLIPNAESKFFCKEPACRFAKKSVHASTDMAVAVCPFCDPLLRSIARNEYFLACSACWLIQQKIAACKKARSTSFELLSNSASDVFNSLMAPPSWYPPNKSSQTATLVETAKRKLVHNLTWNSAKAMGIQEGRPGC